MLISMTGFGKATDTYGSKKITAEIKSLNSKQFDLSVKLPSLYREKELTLRSALSDKLHRGKVDVSLYVESNEPEKKIRLNHALAQNYVNEIREFSKAANFDIEGQLLSAILSMPDILTSERAELQDREWAAVEDIIFCAADNLISFRESEGKKLEDDIRLRVVAIQKLREKIDGYMSERTETVRERIAKNLDEFVNAEVVDKNRLEQEIIYYLEKLDITEEHVRLRGHCHYFLETMATSEMSGKKLGFISQEIGREINTMGAKANHVEIQRLVVQMKDELEKIKEQLLNIV